MNYYKEQQIKEQEEEWNIADEAGLTKTDNNESGEAQYIGTIQQFEKFEELQANQE